MILNKKIEKDITMFLDVRNTLMYDEKHKVDYPDVVKSYFGS